MTLTVRVITPDKIVWDQTAQEVILPSSTGQLGILTDHAPLLTSLDVGVMRVRPDNKEWKSIAVMGGFAEVENNEIKVLVNGAQLGETIDKEQAQIAVNEAQTALDQATAKGDRREQMKATQQLKKAKARLQAAS
ncbi:ATP synthase F1 subunit epsilon [Cyanobacterium aponinum UTEX 3222]|uniref:ATP synthase epsilon chain n=2 Tax=Cyanobacterium aponinum TaxID=379064 RepID=K9Z849_CYAAP|nr:ATP synthase F1 subunit epsilon [Cyanobacterium aponinum]WRL42609.1 ATP synthase F1 subunit epsilon [Cyanobacterium aponinum UTEX 3222]AFZ55371.1 ATP synthase F1 subcomplex epsilon subunit [Cyanobacterium aponinum PCC 10605]MBD2394338.1 F0F1 ATP synthase subunit epsilon [Cyanobacterium aponinum FACHB-4101]PHV62847.1 F0F1 ATP synthase subunit epsilon [Cyanobacterium aponinum IPPAS B-1201]WPF88538.1 ATP synthase F1 subunit epsilon [Cyanobacterium aponinum AL20115]